MPSALGGPSRQLGAVRLSTRPDVIRPGLARAPVVPTLGLFAATAPALGGTGKPRQISTMTAVKAYVKNGRLIVHEPTDLPEGTVVPLEIADDWDDLDDEERAALHESLRESIEQMKAGQTIDIEQALAELRTHQ